MTYSDSDLARIEDLASIFIKISDIAVILDVPPEELRDDIASRSSPAYRAYRRGKVRSIIELRRQEMEFARAGSPLAAESTARALLDMEDDE